MALLAVVLIVAATWGWKATLFPGTPGEDWFWYRNGVDRLLDGRPLYEPAWVLGPYDSFSPANFYQFNQAPWLLPIVVPFTLAAEPWARLAWLAVMDVAFVAALVAVLPQRRRLTLFTLVLLAAPAVMTLTWGNVQPLVILGVTIWLISDGSPSLVVRTASLVLASIKVVPAVPLALLMLRRGEWQPVLAATLVIATAAVTVSVIEGTLVAVQFVPITANAVAVTDGTNISPAVMLGTVMSPDAAQWVVRAVGVTGMVAAALFVRERPLAIAGAEFAGSLLVTNLYATWLLVPLFALLWHFRQRETRGDLGVHPEASVEHAPAWRQ